MAYYSLSLSFFVDLTNSQIIKPQNIMTRHGKQYNDDNDDNDDNEGRGKDVSAVFLDKI
jgi:hypothetical protein